jgi:Tol biopolymer transport system component
VLSNLPDGSFWGGGAWNANGVILIGRAGGAICQISAAGGDAKPVLKLDESRTERSQLSPEFLPDGRHFLYTSATDERGRSGIYVASLDGAEPRQLLSAETDATFVYPNFLLFARGGSLLGQRFDRDKLRLLGKPVPVAESAGSMNLYAVHLYSASRNGILLYRPWVSTNLQLTWVSRDGKRSLVGEPRPYQQGSLSPDEKQVAVQMTDAKRGQNDVWVLDLPTGILSRVTDEGHKGNNPQWSPDGRELLFSSFAHGHAMLYRKVLGGNDGEPAVLSRDEYYPGEWLKDGSILFMNLHGRSFFRLPAGNGAKPETLLETEYDKDEPRVSPDGRWVVYNATESGRWEVYVATFPAFTERRQISNNGGVQGYWRKDGKELFYLTPDGILTSVPVKSGAHLETGSPHPLFRTRIPVTALWDQYAAAGDGQRFLMLEVPEGQERTLSLVLNWPALMKK